MVSNQGKNVIVDTVICNDEYFAMFQETLAGYPVTMVRVECPVEELNRREQARGDREIGQTVSQVEDIVSRDKYDLTINTYTHSKKENARYIVEFLTTGGR